MVGSMQPANSSTDSVNPPISSAVHDWWDIRQIPISVLICLFLLIPLIFGLPLIRDSFPILFPVVGSRAFICLGELLFSVVVLVGLADHRKINRFSFLLFLTWMIFTILSTISAEKIVPAIVRQAEWFSHILFSFSLYILLSKIRYFNFFLFALVISGFLLFLSSLCLIWFNMPNPLLVNWVVSVPGFRNIRHFGYYNVVAIIFAAGLLLSYRSLLKIFGIIVMIIGWIFIFWSGSRSAFVSLIVSACVVKIFLYKKSYSFFKWFIIALFLGLILQQAIFPDLNGSLGVKRWIDKFDGGIINTDINNISSGRMRIWKTTFIHIFEKPLLGFGPDGFIYLQPNPAPELVHPHNLLLQLAIEWGVIGLVLFIIIGIYLIVISLKKINKESSDNMNFARITGLWLLLDYVVFGLIDGTFYHPFSLLFLAIASAMAVQGIAVSDDFPFVSILTYNIIPICIVLLGIVILHFSVLSFQRDKLDPDSWQLKIIKIFPSSLLGFELTLERWLDEGRMEDVIGWSRWAQNYARFPERFAQIEKKALAKQKLL